MGRGLGKFDAILSSEQRTRGGGRESGEGFGGQSRTVWRFVIIESFLAGLLELRNTAQECGLSPAQIVFGRQLRSIIPAHRSLYAQHWKAAAAARERQADAQAASKLRYDSHTRPLFPLSIVRTVRIQDPSSKLWSHVGVIMAVGRYRLYRIKFASGSVLWRNRRFLRPMVAAPSEEAGDAEKHAGVDGEGDLGSEPGADGDGGPGSKENRPTSRPCPPADPPALRRSSRMRKPRTIISV